MKDVKKLLSEHKSEILPDANVKDKVKRELGLDEKESSLAYAHGGEHALSDGRKTFLAVVAVFVIVALFICIFIPLWLRGGSPAGDIIAGNKFDSITDADSFYAYGAASVGSILSSSEGTGGAASASACAVSAAESSSPSYDAQVETLNKYLSMVESLLGDGAITGATYEEDGEYAYRMTVTASDLLGGTSSYTLYYNKTFVGSSVEDDEFKENYSLDGVLIVEGVSYPVTGNYETETEEDEQESELYFRAYTDDTGRSYIEVRQEYESEDEDGGSETEVEYVYTVVQDGKVKEKAVVEYEQEDGELELVMTITRDGNRETLVFEDESENGRRVIAVRGTLNGERVSFRIYVSDGEYDYVFDDGSHFEGDRNNYDDDDD